MNRWLLPALFAAALATACAEPPNKEMDQAQGAIDAARAAGADVYAATEFTAALDSLKSSHAAVENADYRLALDTALASRDHARNAAREAADTKARLRSETERSLADIALVMAQATTSLQAAERARVPRATLQRSRTELAAINDDVQKAGQAVKAGNYIAAKPLLDGVKPRAEKVLAELETRATSQSPRRRR